MRNVLTGLITLLFFSLVLNAKVFNTDGNKITPLRTGTELNARRMEIIKHADKFLYIKTFIITKDPTEAPVYEALCKKAWEGLDVRILVDAVGGLTSGGKEHMTLWGGKYSVPWFRACGIRFEFYNPLNALYRQHDKMFVSEDAAIIGGSNFSKDYSLHGQLSPYWYDYDIALEGPALCGLQEIFADSWVKASRQKLNVRSKFSIETLDRQCHYPEAAGIERMMTIHNDPQDTKRRPFVEYFTRSMQAVVDQHGTNGIVRLYAPYFVPNKAMQDKLIQASMEGARIRIITNSAASIDPEAFDAYVAMLLRAPALMAGGVELYLWNPVGRGAFPYPKSNVLHRKGGCFHEFSCYVGSHNFDVRGDEHSSELISVLYSTEFMQNFASEFDADLGLTTRLDYPLLEKLLKDTKITSEIKARVGGWSM